MKILNVKFVVVGSLFIALITLLLTHSACTTYEMKNDRNFDLQAGEIIKPDGTYDE